MAHASFIIDSLLYGRQLLHAGVDGIRAGERLTSCVPEVRVAVCARQSLWAAALGSSVALIACRVVDKNRPPLAPVVACGAASFCADFIWRTRSLSSKMIECAEREITKVRDQHWLDSHPIDYA